MTNEQVTYVAGTLTITKAPLTVGVKNETITEGDAIPTFTLIFSGFRNSDTEATAFTKSPHSKYHGHAIIARRYLSYYDEWRRGAELCLDL